ncbi:hypothetical protein OGAPHI_006934 [Ogataea philodendri]|uniref:Protein kinase domain-containing protein n=1 Tax=Ogataea philodendri TaxID=1378263 RepID=A0A9P8SZ43_9ASCO|nr:uncharacterized protein OGAPHI_006934 [Ogataea philodendri]KAH3660348.1 hypothetical protein OGAPHI_006934 [Ogataea philodendri]
MSIVRYNDQHLSVVHHNKLSNSVVLYNSQTKDLELVHLDNEESPGYGGGNGARRRSVPSQFEFVCPDCGYQFNIDPTSVNQSGGSPPTGSRPDFLHNDYFKLLAKVDAGNETNRELISSLFRQSHPTDSEKIPVELINQGYFKKFFTVLGVLGNGSNGKVIKVEHKLYNLQLGVFALKKIAIGNHFGNLVRILNEVKFLYSLTDSSNSGNLNIIKYNHVWLEVDQISDFGPRVPVVFILFEYCDGGTLEEMVEETIHPRFNINEEKLLRRRRKAGAAEKSLHQRGKRYLNNFEIYKIFKDVLNGLHHLHEQKILHRDLKPSNCLFKTKFPEDYKPVQSVRELDRIPNLVVSDFGESIMENSKRSSTGNTGTLEYCAPELFEIDQTGRLHDFSYKSDIYSLGMILYYLCFGKLPFKSSDQSTIREEILKSDIFDDMETLRTDGLLPAYLRLIRMMVDPDYTKRPESGEILVQLESVYEQLTPKTYKPVAEISKSRWLKVVLLMHVLVNIWICPYQKINNVQFMVLGGILWQRPPVQVLWIEMAATLILLVLNIDSYRSRFL